MNTLPEEEKIEDGIKIRGFFRVQIKNQDGSLFGDSGWCKNNVTNEGIRHFLARALGALAGSSQIGSAALGTGGAPADGDTTLAGELGENVRAAVTAATSGSTSVQFTGTFDSANSFATASRNISNIGLFAGAGGTLFAGNTYTSSACATNQNVQFTYRITFSG